MYGYDNLNRLITETAQSGEEGYEAAYIYDLVGNRTQRVVDANGQCMQTDYDYNSRDQLIKETHTDPGVCLYINDKPVYAYTADGRITHYRLYGSSENISPLKAYLLGIPSKWSGYAMKTFFGLTVILLLLPFVGCRVHRVRYLLRQALLILLAYVMLIDPAFLYHESQAAINYSSLSTSDWGTNNRDIHYYYDANGSLIKKTEAVKDTADPDTTFIEKTVYVYNLQNRLAEVQVTADGVNWDVTTYKYNDDGIRVEKNDNGTVTSYLVDSFNHTGYAQVLEQWDTTATPTLTKTYIIGDDCLGEADNSSSFKYYLHDGQSSVRHHSDSDGDLIAYSGCDTFAYDAYGHRVDPLRDTVNDGLFYTGQQWDNSADMYYLRARYYNPLNGRFNRVDPYSGNTQDPQSLHKYLYCHANPVNGIDPSGKFFTMAGAISAVSIQSITGALMAISAVDASFRAKSKLASGEGIFQYILDNFFSKLLDWVFFGTRQTYNWVLPSPIPGSQFTISAGIEGDFYHSFTSDGSATSGAMIRIYASGGIHVFGSVPPGATPRLKNWTRPVSLPILARKWMTPGQALRIPFRHGFQETELGDYLTGEIGLVVSAGWSSLALGYRHMWSLTDGTRRKEAGFGVGQGTGIAIELGLVLKLPY